MHNENDKIPFLRGRFDKIPFLFGFLVTTHKKYHNNDHNLFHKDDPEQPEKPSTTTTTMTSIAIIATITPPELCSW